MSLNLLLFLILAGIAVLSALGMLLSRNALYSALYLIINFITVAVMYLTLHAPFIAIVQITVYTGAIMVLFVFVIMLLGAEQIGSRHPQRWFLPLAIFLGAVLLIETMYIVLYQLSLTSGVAEIAEQFGSPKAIGELLFSQYLLPFEATSVLLLVAMIGAIVLTKREKNTPRVNAGTNHPAGTGGYKSPEYPAGEGGQMRAETARTPDHADTRTEKK
jgi:NADH-quinone oxidoreductase subunit J